MPVNEVAIDQHGEVMVLNTTSASSPEIIDALRRTGEGRIADAMMQWVQRVQKTSRRKSRFGGILDRDKFLAPDTYFGQVQLAREALKDDVVGGAADGTESLALEHVTIECNDDAQQDVWNQIAADIDLDDQLRKHWRGLFTDSSVVPCMWWGTKNYTPRTLGPKGSAKSRAQFNVQVPLGITFFDVTKIVPVGPLHFGQEALCYAAEPLEAMVIDQILAARDGTPVPRRDSVPRAARPLRVGAGTSLQVLNFEATPDLLRDPMIERLILGHYQPDPLEDIQLKDDGVEDTSRLYLLDPRSVFRHSLTRMDYQRFPECRAESWFELLDLKAQLRQVDRVHLVGGANMIILITKGSDKLPAEQPEIDALQANATTLATVPLLVGDHRLDVKIITPSLDVTLNRDKWDTIDVRLFARTWGSFIPTGTDLADPTKIGRVIGRNLESRRKMMRRRWEAKVLLQIMARNPQKFTERPKIVFQPTQIGIAFDAAWASFILDLYEMGGVAHGTALSQFGFNIADEFRKVMNERREYGRQFQENAPFNPHGPQSGNGGGGDDDDPDDPDGGDGDGDDGGDGGSGAPTRVARRSGGRRGGGTRNGGGAAPGTGQGQAPTGRSRSGGGRRSRTEEGT